MSVAPALPVDVNALAQQALAAQPRQNGRVERAAQDFEAMFATQMLSPMWESVEVDENFGGGHGEQVFRTFMLQEYGRIAAASGTLGITDHVRRTMLEIQAGRQS